MGRVPPPALDIPGAELAKRRLSCFADVGSPGGVQLAVASASRGAVGAHAGDPALSGAVTVCRWGVRFPGAGVIVGRKGRPATRRSHADAYSHPPCCAW